MIRSRNFHDFSNDCLEPMQGMSEDELEDFSTADPTDQHGSTSNRRAEREAKLLKMMDDEGESKWAHCRK